MFTFTNEIMSQKRFVGICIGITCCILFQMIVPKKRTALLIDRLMVSLQKALEEEQARENEENSALSSKSDVLRTVKFNVMLT